MRGVERRGIKAGTGDAFFVFIYTPRFLRTAQIGIIAKGRWRDGKEDRLG